MQSPCRTLLWSAAFLALGSTALVVGCSSTPEERRDDALADLRSYLRGEVADPARSKQALAVLDELDALAREAEALRGGFHKELAALHRDHGVDDAQLLARAERFRTERASLRARLLGRRTAMRQALAPAEWSGYAEREAALVEASQKQESAR